VEKSHSLLLPSSYKVFREDMEIKPVMQDGLVKDWDMLERVWEHAITNHLKVEVRQTPVLLAEKSYNSPSARQK